MHDGKNTFPHIQGVTAVWKDVFYLKKDFMVKNKFNRKENFCG